LIMMSFSPSSAIQPKIARRVAQRAAGHRSGIRPDLTSGMVAFERFSGPNESAL